MLALTLALVASPALQDAPAAAPGARWPGFRGVGTGHTAATDLPERWSEPAWIAPLPGYGQSSPVVWDGRVYVTSVDGAEKELAYVTCLRLDDGQPLWIRSFEASARIPFTDTVSRGAPTPTVDGERVYAFFESGDLIALDRAGELAWRVDLHERFGPFQGNHGVGSSPVLAGGTLALLLDHAGPSHLVALDPATGADRWIVEREPHVSWATPVEAAAGGELVVSSNGSVEGFALADGKARWRVEGIVGNTVPSPTAVGRRVVVGCGKGAGLVLVERAEGGEAALAWSGDELAPSGFGSPLVLGGSVLLVNTAGVASSVALDTGALEWKERLGSGGAWASPVTDGERVWLFGKEGLTSVFRWTPEGPEELAVNELASEGGVHGVAAVDGTFLLREPSRLLCVRAATEQGE